MAFLTDLALRGAVWITEVTPSPTPIGNGAYTGDEDLISPTWVGFTATFLVALAVVFLLIDMNRRVRRVRYRDEVREKLEAEQAERTDIDAADGEPQL